MRGTPRRTLLTIATTHRSLELSPMRSNLTIPITLILAGPPPSRCIVRGPSYIPIRHPPPSPITNFFIHCPQCQSCLDQLAQTFAKWALPLSSPCFFLSSFSSSPTQLSLTLFQRTLHFYILYLNLHLLIFIQPSMPLLATLTSLYSMPQNPNSSMTSQSSIPQIVATPK